MSKYDYFVAGRWRNRDAVNEVVAELRAAGKTVHNFIENNYNGDGIKFDSNQTDLDAMMKATESLDDWETNPTFRKIFEHDMQAERDSDALILVFPAGLAAHMEFGAAYGMGKPCYGIGKPDKTETLYLMFDKVYPDVQAFIEDQVGVSA